MFFISSVSKIASHDENTITRDTLSNGKAAMAG
jgi:hypothetical protein